MYKLKTIFKAVVLKILEWEGRLVIKKYKPTIIAITGNVGKTTTKDAIYEVLEKLFDNVRKSPKSYNSDFGVPLTILGRNTGWNSPLAWILNILAPIPLLLFPMKYPNKIVLEVGADKPNDIKKISSWLHADRVVVTQMSSVPVHIEAFGTVERIIEEKSELIKSIKRGGLVILNADDEHAPKFAVFSENKPFYVGFRNSADLQASNYQINYNSDGRPRGITFKINHRGSCAPVSIDGVIGKGFVYPILFATVLGLKEGGNLVSVGQALSSFKTTPGRMRILKGQNDSSIIDDSYNSSPLAVLNALDCLSELQCSGRKIAVLGDMLELGEYSEDQHQKIGRLSGEVADLVVGVGKMSEIIAAEAKLAGAETLLFKDSKQSILGLKDVLKPGDICLVKGSQSVRMERLVYELVEKEERVNLVRQDLEWQKK